METIDAAAAFAALGHAGRLDIVAMLLDSGADGLTPSKISSRTGAPANSVSSQLKVLSHARLITQERQGRQITYRANQPAIEELRQLLSR